MTVPQVGAMYSGDRSRKMNLVDYGFRLPSALDNRPLNFSEFEQKIDQVMFVSATPGKYEEEHQMLMAEQIIRPTGLLDPPVEVRPVGGQKVDSNKHIKYSKAEISHYLNSLHGVYIRVQIFYLYIIVPHIAGEIFSHT